MLLPGLEAAAGTIPEIRRQLLHARVEEVGVLDGLVAVVVLGVHADDRRLDAQVDVLRHQRHARLRVLALQRHGVREDRVVGAVTGQRVGQPGRHLSCLEEQAPGRRLLATVHRLGGGQFEPAVDLLLGRAGHQLVEEATHLAHVARRLRHAFLARVELLEHDHRDEDVVFLEAEDARGVVHQDVGVEKENTALGGLLPGRQRRTPVSGEGAGRIRGRAQPRGLRRRARPPSPCATPAAARPARRSGRCCARRPCTSCRTCSSPSTRRRGRRPSSPRR